MPVKHALRTQYTDLLSTRVMHPQITTLAIDAQSGPRLEYLQLGKQKPRPIPSLKAAIEDEFMLLDRKFKKAPLDEKTLKRKIKAEEKMTARELKKDTLVL